MKRNQTNLTTRALPLLARRGSACLLLTLLYAGFIFPLNSQAESLFRAGTTYTADAPLQPRSLFTPPISREVGDIVTIQIKETTTQDATSELKITRSQTINENGSNTVNNMVGFMLDKLPFNSGRLKNILSVPTMDGVANSNNLSGKAESTRSTTITDNITCQVVQVLPNGDLMVQGQKTIQVNKERGDLIVSGIVKPYYLDRNNQISSKMVANFQMIQGGRGVISRQQNDSLANKVYQFFN